MYYINSAKFNQFQFIIDNVEDVKDDLGAFLAAVGRVIFAVNCENSDPYKLCTVLGGLKEAALCSDALASFSKIQKIIQLYEAIGISILIEHDNDAKILA